MPRRFRVAMTLAAAVTVFSTVIAVLALRMASGVTRPRGQCCTTEFIDGTISSTVWLAVPVVGAVAYFSARAALLATVGVVVPTLLAMHTAVERYAETGWGDGLEVLGYLQPIGVALACLFAVFLGWVVARPRHPRRVPDQDQ